MAQDFASTTKKYTSYQISLNAAPTNYLGVLDNSTNIHILCNRSLFIDEITPCSLRTDIGTIIISNLPARIGMAKIS